MTACLDETTAAGLIAGELDSEAAEAARRHLAGCRDCERFAAELARATIDDTPDDPPLTGGELRRGTTIDRYLVLGRIGIGGMGEVHAAYDVELDRRVALKLLRRDVSARGGDDGRAWLVREAKVAARLSHPNVVSVFDIGTVEDRVYVAMEYVEGITLAEWLRGDHGWQAILDVFLEAGRGLAAAHEAGVIHRDFKPDNVLVGRDGRARVADFGLARGIDSDARSAPFAALEVDPDETQPASRGAGGRLTRTGALLGTPRFMAPEQFTGGETTPRTDQFAFCVALYAALYRNAPFRGDRVSEIATRVTAGEIEPPATQRGPAELRRAIVRGLAVDPARRHASMPALLRELVRARGARRRRWTFALAGTAAIGVVTATLVVGFAVRDRAEPPCTNAAAKLRTTWNQDRAARIRLAFAGHALPFAVSAAHAVTTRVDAYARAWTAMRTEACVATHVDGEQSPQLLDLRVACLDERLAELAAFVGALETADAETVRRSIDAADRLPALSTCADRIALASPVAPPSAEIATEAATIVDRLAPATALQNLGKPALALAAAERACAGVDALAYAPLVARCRYELGVLVDDATGDHATAIARMTEALTAATAGNDQRRSAEAAIVLARLLGDRSARYDEAERWAKLAASAIERLADGRDLAAKLASVRSMIATRRGQMPEALARAEELLALTKELHPRGGLPVANAKVYVGHALVALGRTADAEPQYREALAIIEEVSGTSHPSLIPVLDGLSNVEFTRNKPAAALPHLERSLAITRSIVGPNHSSAITAQANFGAALTNAGQLDRAIAELAAARQAVSAADRRELALVLTNLVVVHQQRGEHDRAFAVATEALAVEREVNGDDHVSTALAHFNVGDTLLSVDRPHDAVTSIRTALAVWERALPADHPYLVTGRLALDDALSRTKRRRR